MGIALNLKKMIINGTLPSKIYLAIFPCHFKFLNFIDTIGIFDTISHDRKRMIAKSI